MELAGYLKFPMSVSKPLSRDESSLKEISDGDEFPVSGEEEIVTGNDYTQLEELLTNTIRGLNPVKIKILLSFLEWLKRAPDEIFEIQESPPERVLSSRLKEKILKRDNYRCSNCGSSDTNLYFSHIVPLSRGGRNEPDNLTTLCEICAKLTRYRGGTTFKAAVF